MKAGWTDAQEKAILAPCGWTVAVSAGAGTGKTSVLSETVAMKIVKEGGFATSDLLVLTFTRKAAAEMAQRIEKRLKELADETAAPNEKRRLLMAADEVADADIDTLDAFAARLLRDNASQSGLDPGFEVIDPDDDRLLGEEVAKRLLEKWLDSPPDKNWVRLMEETFVQNWSNLLVSLDAHLVSRGEILKGMLILGRGRKDYEIETGIRDFIGKRQAEIEQYVSELQSAFDGLEGFLAETSKCRKKDGDPYQYAETARILIPQVEPVRQWLKRRDFDWGNPALDRVSDWKLSYVREGASEVALEAKRRLEFIRPHLTGAENDEPTLKSLWIDLHLLDHRNALAAGVCEFHEEFVRARRDQNALSFSDCEMEALRLVERNPEVRDRLKERYKYVLVDEYQDINPLQQSLVFALCDRSDAANKSPVNLYVVGDERQSIFGFRDADCRLIAELRHAEGTECRSLTENFRSRSQILDFVNRAFGRIWQSSEMGMALVPAYPGYKLAKRKESPRIELHLLKTEDTESGRALEAWLIAKRLWEIVKVQKTPICEKRDDKYGTREIQWGDCAILMRTRGSLSKFEEALGALEIPFRTESGGGFWGLPEIADIRALLMCMSALSDDIDLAISLRSPWVGISDDGLLEITDAASGPASWSEAIKRVELSDECDRARLKAFIGWFNTLTGMAGRVPVGRLLEEAFRISEYAERVFAQSNGRAVRANIDKLIGYFSAGSEEFDVGAAARRIEWLRSSGAPGARATIEPEEEGGAVTLATVHVAKGLEWPLVVLPDLSRGVEHNVKDEVLWDEDKGLAFKWLNPATGAREKPDLYTRAASRKKEFEIAEEKRLLYVALTRAREWLILSSGVKESKDRTKWTRISTSWLGYLENAFQEEGISLVGTPDGPEAEAIEGLALRRTLYNNVELEKIRPSDESSSSDTAKELINALGALPEIPEPSSRRYMVTATEIAAFALCPRMYAYRAVWSVPGRIRQAERLSSKPDEDQPDQPESFEFPAAEWGTLVHKIMERVPLNADEAEIRKEVVQTPGVPLQDKARIKRLVEMVEGTLKLPIMERLRGSVDEIKREYRILGRLPGADEVVLGILDVASASDGKVTLIDYKSGKVKKEDAENKANDYETQMAIYAALAASRWGVDPSDVDAHLIFLDPDPPIDNVVKVDPGMIDRASGVVRKLSDWSRESRFTADPSPEKCSHCDFSDICRFSKAPK